MHTDVYIRTSVRLKYICYMATWSLKPTIPIGPYISSSLLGLPYRIPHINPQKKELLRTLNPKP